MSNTDKIRLLASRLSSLREQLNISRDILVSASKEIDQLYAKENKKKLTQKNKKSSENFKKKPNFEESDSSNLKENVNAKAKSLYRKIAFKTHPDKFDPDLSPSELNEKEKIFREATLAIENNDIISLYDIAIKEGLEVPEISEHDIEFANNKIKAVKEELNFIESTLAWKWYFAKNKQEKESILKNMFKLMNDC